MRTALSDLLAGAGLLVLDGAMGTELARRGLEMGGQNCLSAPEAVAAVHQAYAEAGCTVLLTNTLTMNRIQLAALPTSVDVREVNLAGARLARQAAGTDRYVLGDMTSTGKLLEPYGDLAESEARAAFREQAECLAEGGVDGFIIETMMDLNEALCALRACKEVSPLPVFLSMAFSTLRDGGRTIMGNSAADCARAAAEAGAQAVGANCGEVDPFEVAQIVAAMRRVTDLPILAEPNAGKPKLVEGRTVFDMTPAAFAEGVVECVRAGARLVGGCCGTSPAHLRAAVTALASRNRTS